MDFERINFNYSVKNIPVPSKNQSIYRIIEKTENVIKNMRWKAHFLLKEHNFIKEDDYKKKDYHSWLESQLSGNGLKVEKGIH